MMRGRAVAAIRRTWPYQLGREVFKGATKPMLTSLVPLPSSFALSTPRRMHRVAIAALALVSSHALCTAPSHLQSGHQLRLEPLYPLI
jgi:hypothetical protein